MRYVSENRPRISVKRQVFSVLASSYFRGAVNSKHTVYPNTSTLNISQHCMIFGKLTYKRFYAVLHDSLAFTKSFGCLVPSWFVLSRVVKKPTTRQTSHTNDFVNAIKSRAREKRLSQGRGYYYLPPFSRLRPWADANKTNKSSKVAVALSNMSQKLLRFNKLDDSTVWCTNYIFQGCRI